MIYKIKSAAKKKDVTTARGTFTVYRITIEHQGEDIDADIMQKPESPAPTGEMDLTLEETQYGWKAKKVAAPFAQKSGGFTRQSNPEERQSIERQVCLKAATELAVAHITQGKKLTTKDVLKAADVMVGWLTDHKSIPAEPTEEPVETVTKEEIETIMDSIPDPEPF